MNRHLIFFAFVTALILPYNAIAENGRFYCGDIEFVNPDHYVSESNRGSRVKFSRGEYESKAEFEQRKREYLSKMPDLSYCSDMHTSTSVRLRYNVDKEEFTFGQEDIGHNDKFSGSMKVRYFDKDYFYKVKFRQVGGWEVQSITRASGFLAYSRPPNARRLKAIESSLRMYIYGAIETYKTGSGTYTTATHKKYELKDESTGKVIMSIY